MPHPFADPDAAARKIVEIANGVEAVQDGRIYIELVNAPFLAAGGSGNDFRAGIARAIANSAGCDSSKVCEAIGEADDLDRNHPLSA